MFLVLLAIASTLGRELFAGPGQPLWVASGEAITLIDSASGRALSHIQVDGGLRAFAVDPGRREVWALVGNELRNYSETGQPGTVMRLDIPVDGNAALALDRRSRQVWVAVDTGVMLLDEAGRHVWSRPLRGPLVDVALDARRSWIWVATEQQLELMDAQGRLLQQLSLVNSGPLRALTYDAHLDQAWLIGESSLERYTWEGERTLIKILPSDHAFAHLVADGQGGVWAASRQHLAHFDAVGEPASLTTRLDLGDGAAPLDLASDAAHGAVWIAGREELRHVGYSGALLRKLLLPPVGEAPSQRLSLEIGG